MDLCCQLNGIKCFNSTCQINLGCSLHFSGRTEEISPNDVYHGCEPCHAIVQSMLKNYENTLPDMHSR